MIIKNENIDSGKAFDWGRTSDDYAKYRDIYPQEFYDKIIQRGLCTAGQKVLDVGTGTGVLPRNMHRYGAKWTGTDISENQTAAAKKLSVGMDIDYYTAPTEKLDFPDNSFDVITACQCFWYFDHEKTVKNFYRMLKPNGHILVLYMAWLPYEDKIAGESEKLILKYNPHWSGAGETVHPIFIPDCYREYFSITYHEEYPLKVRFTRESWNGRLKACRGIGASLSETEINTWEQEHKKLLSEITPPEFDIIHYAAVAELKKQGRL
ncbi:MAG: class I SAM-dependent methyltransferase [Ruminococcus sp.]|nr:class I SAM-dependent methyltransferase [Ruminococcus sp.]